MLLRVLVGVTWRPGPGPNSPRGAGEAAAAADAARNRRQGRPTRKRAGFFIQIQESVQIHVHIIGTIRTKTGKTAENAIESAAGMIRGSDAKKPNCFCLQVAAGRPNCFQKRLAFKNISLVSQFVKVTLPRSAKTKTKKKTAAGRRKDHSRKRRS